jgi:hypothetical protein
MQSNAQKLWIPNPNAGTLVDVEALQGPDFANEVRIVDQISILSTSVTRCQKVCASPCEENIWTIEFEDVDFGDCNACGKSVGFTLLLNRNPDFDNQTYFEYNQRRQYVYQGNLSGVVTGIDLAIWFESYINDLFNQNDQHDQFLVSVTRSTNTLTLTFPCSGLIAYSLIGIYQLPNNNLATLELPAFTETQEAVEAVLSREKLLQQFPQEIGHVFGEAPRDQWMWCQTVCVITLKGCIDACSSFFDNQNSGHLHTGATPFDLLLYVDSSAPGFAAFIDQLNLLLPCTLDTAGGLQAGVQAPYDAGDTILDISLLEYDTINGTPFTVTAGPVKIVVTATSGADLETQINNLFAGSVIYSAGPPEEMTFTSGVGLFGEFAATTGFISIVPVIYTNLVGE